MWTDVVSSWRRLLGRDEHPSSMETLLPERRVWIRHLWDIETTYRSLRTPEGDRRSVHVQNISCGGIKLVTDHWVDAGAILGVELPGPTEGATYTVLASVVNVSDQANGTWALGCAFTQELSENELRTFGASRIQTSFPDQRNLKRFPCAATASYQRVNDPAAGRHTASMLDVSSIGIGLLVTQSLEVGQLLQLKLLNPDRESGPSVLALVSRVTARQEAGWVVGCSFIRELGNQELKALLD